MAKLALKKEYKPHKEYKDSGVEWLGNIPDNWNNKRLKGLFNLSNERVEDSPDVQQILSVSGYRGIEKKDISTNGGQMPSDDVSQYRVVRPGQLVVNTMWLNYTGLGVSKYTGYVSPAYRAYYLDDEVDCGFIHYLMRSESYVQKYSSLLYGIRPNSLQVKPKDFEAIDILVPPKEEQEKIADFLDEKITLIDSVIEKKKKLIELLKEKRSAVINNAVTKGLDPKAELIDSGVVWIGRTPKDWKVVNLKSFGQAIIGLTYSPENIVSENGTAVLRSSNVKDGQTIMEDVVYVDKKVSKKLTLRKNDILICSRNGSKKLIGKNAKIGDGLAGQTFGAFMTVYRSKNNDFVYWFLNSNIFLAQTELFISSTINQLTIDSLKNLKISLPDENTQKEVTAYLAKRDPEFRKAVVAVEKSIDNLQEFKSSLISHAVTGKIKI